MNPEFLQHFHALFQYERAYHNFGFIVQKGNLSGIRRDVCFFIFNYSKTFSSIENTQSMLF